MDAKLTRTFCTVLDDFLNDMYKSYPDPSLLVLMTTSKAIIAGNPGMIVKNYMDCIEPYADKIKTKDETFLLSGGLADNLKKTQYSFLIEELDKISQIWRKPETSEKTKASIWKYLQVLQSLGNKILG